MTTSRYLSMTPAVVALRRARIQFQIHSFEPDGTGTGYGAEAARALGVSPCRVFKTLVLAADSPVPLLLVACVPVDRQLDLRALAHLAHVKRVDLAPAAAAQRATGYVVGGISPLGQRKRLGTVIDASVRDHDTVFVSGGRRGLEIELTPADLLALCAARTAPICKLHGRSSGHDAGGCDL